MKTRTIVVARHESGQPLGKVLRTHLAWSWSQVRHAVSDGRVRVNGAVCRNLAHKLTRGLRLEVTGASETSSGASQPRVAKASRPHLASMPKPKAVYQGPQPIICYADADVVVVDKPAGLTTMRHPREAAEFGARARRFLPPTLAELLPELLTPNDSKKKRTVFAVHRLDKDTSGLVVFARTKQAESAGASSARVVGSSPGHRTRPGTFGTDQSTIAADRDDSRRGAARIYRVRATCRHPFVVKTWKYMW